MCLQQLPPLFVHDSVLKPLIHHHIYEDLYIKEKPAEDLQLTKITLRHLCLDDMHDTNNDGQAISIKDGPHPASHPPKLYLRCPYVPH